jgi:hypothetical protein
VTSHRVRISIAIVVVVGCKKSVGPQQARDVPRPTGFAAMSSGEQCTATAPRSRPCHNELLKAELRSVGASDVLDARKDFDEPVDDREAETLQANECLGSPGYARAIFECWSQPSCDALAKCTIEHAARLEGSAAPGDGSSSDVPHDGNVHLSP